METYHGHVRTPSDAILLFEACRIGLLPRVQRRLSEKERQQIRSGSVFVWDEREAGMRRWTDGKSWSASRVSGSFLTYREMEGKRGGSLSQPTPKRASGKSPEGSVTGDSEGEGPDGYRYKPDGLMKQSFSITTSSGQHLHLISYYTRSNNLPLTQPSTDPNLRHIRPPKNMYPESTINETQPVPAVTRGPLPSSPYSPSSHPMGSPSPYSRPGSQQPPVYVPVFPHTPPNGTPPFQHAYYGHPQIHYYPYGGVVYAPAPGYGPPGHVAPHLGPHGMIHAAPGHPLLARHPSYPGPAAQYAVSGPSPPHPPHANAPHAPPPTSSAPEPGPQLPALHNAGAMSAMKSSTLHGFEARNDPPTLEPTPNAAPARTIPKINSILNGAVSDKPGMLRTSSHSPNATPSSAAGFHSDRLATSMTSATDNRALDKLNRNMFVRT